ncbi:MAG: bifunctional lysylphosphatidylglycerol flippase/synthetase MprF [Candidatus Sumerlaeia bacterium]
MFKRLMHFLPGLLGLILFIAAMAFLHHLLGKYHYDEIVNSLRGIPTNALVIAVLLTITAYAALTLYDQMACLYVGNPLPYRRVALVSYVGYAFANSVGLANMAGGSIRFRFYTSWGFSPLDTTKIVLFCGLSLWLGLGLLTGVLLVWIPEAISYQLNLKLEPLRPIGIALLAAIIVYSVLCTVWRRPVSWRGMELALPSPGLVVSQFVLGSLDWLLCGAVLYMLLPESSHISFPLFVAIFMLGHAAGGVSQVPGGLGVFESMMLVALRGTAPEKQLIGSLLAYRAIYYLLPLIGASVALGVHELTVQRKQIRQIGHALSSWVPPVVPQVLVFSTFFAGVVLLVSGALPPSESRLHWLTNFVPLPLMEASHFLGSIIGMGLLILARGLQRRLDAAYWLTAVLMFFAIVASVLKGFNFEESIILVLLLIALLPARRHFYRRASLFSEPFTWSWVIALTLVLATSIWLGIFAHRHDQYTDDLWWRFAFDASAPRFLRASVGAACVALLAGIAQLLRGAEYLPTPPTAGELDRILPIVKSSPATYPWLVMLGDKQLLVGPNSRSFLMFGVEGRSWIALREPIGLEADYADLLWRFRELVDHHGGHTVFYQIGPRHLNLFIDLGLALMKIGEEGYVDLGKFSLEGRHQRDFRQAINRIEQEDGKWEVLPAGSASGMLDELKAVSDAWLKGHAGGEKGFSLGYFSELYLNLTPIVTVRIAGRLAGFANIEAGGGKDELTIDLMRYLPDAPAGVMDYLFVRLMQWGREHGYKRFNLGMTPLAGLENHTLAPVWNKIGGMIYRHGEHFYNFKGLRQYKEKFHPQWEPRYLATPGGLVTPRVLIDLAALIARKKQ